MTEYTPAGSARNGLRLLSALVILITATTALRGESVGVWEKVEITLHSQDAYENAYTDVEVWVDLKGPGFEKRCYGFWDGGNTFRVRIMARAPGAWKWTSGSKPSDPGLTGKTGEFAAVEWTQAEKKENPCRRGTIKAAANGHAFEYADGEPYFLLGDTWWSAVTYRYRWYDDDKPKPMGPKAGFKDFVRYRRKQGFNCIAMIAAFPHWANDDKPAKFGKIDDSMFRLAWPQAGTESAKEMTDENGNRVFLFPGKVAGYEKYFPDVNRINPEYFRNFDKKIDYLNANGFVPFIEASRRDVGPAWHKYYDWPDTYTRYIQYIWARYQANICLYSPIHYDSKCGIPLKNWNVAANKVIEKYGRPPFGTLAGCNPAGSSLEYFDHRRNAKWITFHQIGNSHSHDSFESMTDIFNASPPLPGINGEPYYAGMHGEPGGSEGSARNCRAQMYGSVLSGGYGGHIYGAGDKAPAGGAMWAGEVEDVDKPHIWDAIQWPSGAQVQHLRTFVMSEGLDYRQLEPRTKLLSPHKSKVKDFDGWDGCVGWSYCSRTPDRELFMIYFEKGCQQATLAGALPQRKYKVQWFNPRNGKWSDAETGVVTADKNGTISLPPYPEKTNVSNKDWAMKLTLTK